MANDDGWQKIIDIDYSPKDWRMDPKGYFLIRINKKEYLIELGFMSAKGEKIARISGKHPIEIYYTIFKHELISKYEHAAYLGLELQKAYTALQQGLKYIQDDELDFNKKD